MSLGENAIAARRGLPAGQGLRLVMLGLGTSVVPLDTAVNIAFPDITDSFGLPLAMIQWVVICYVLTYASLMLACGRIGDIAGHARVFRTGLAWSVVAFLLCAAAPSFGGLLFFRFLQGIGAGLVISCAPALVTGLYPESRRGRAVGMFTLIFALSSAVGPLIGGVLVARFGWPAVFWFRAPIALVSLLFLHRLPIAERGSGERFDIAGALLLVLGLTTMLLAINRLSLWLAALAIAGFAGFIWWEARAPQPIVRIGLFRAWNFAVLNLINAVMNLAAFSVLLIVPYFFARFSALPLGWKGAVLATTSATTALVSPYAGRASQRVAAERLAALGLVAVGAGLFLTGGWRPETAWPEMVATLSLQGIGVGLFQVAYLDLVLRSSAIADRGVAGSLSVLTRTIGTVSGAAVLTLGFHTLQSAAASDGADAAAGFLSAYRGLFHLAGAAVALTALALPWWRSRPRQG